MYIEMHLALSLAQTAAEQQEVPVGAVVTYKNKIIGTGFNRRETEHCVSSHAEISAIKEASQTLKSWRLSECTLFSTLEPCIMCAGAIYQARIKKVVYGAEDHKGGAMGSLYNIHSDKRLNHQVQIEAGAHAHECSQLLKNFFRNRRLINKQKKDSLNRNSHS